MKVLAVDVGTGTQDILLFDSRFSLENSFKMVLPSPTMIIHHRIRQATAERSPILLTGRQMGGGPSSWAAETHVRAGLEVFATPRAALTIDDDLSEVAARGVTLISEDEARGLGPEVRRIQCGDLDLGAIAHAFERFGVGLNDLDAVAVAVFDHGAAPPGTSDRQFRFDYLDQRIRSRNSLSTFAFIAAEVPSIMTRLRAVAESASDLNCPLVVMDTAPAAILGATFDPTVADRGRQLLVNVGNFHALAFRLGGGSIEGLFEHHTGEIDLPKLERFLVALADGSLQHEDIFDDMGHGALVYAGQPLSLGDGDYDVVVTGPRRGIFENRQVGGHPPERSGSPLRPYFAAPFGDMMLAGCFGLLATTAEVVAPLADGIHAGMEGSGAHTPAPWDP